MSLTFDNAIDRRPGVQVRGRVRVLQPEVTDITNAMLVGPTERGPAFVPREINNIDELNKVFGSGQTFVTSAARRVLNQTDRVKITRVMNSAGWNPVPIVITSNAFDMPTAWPSYPYQADQFVLIILVPNEEFQTKYDLSQVSIAGDVSDFRLRIRKFDGSPGINTKLSFDPNSKNHVPKIIGNIDGLNVYQNFVETQEAVFRSNPKAYPNVISVFDSLPLDMSGIKWKAARTPWILSRVQADMTRERLFRFVAKSDGSSENTRFKISIRNIGGVILNSNFKSFDVIIRRDGDTDLNEQVLERFRRVNLDPNSDRFIAKVIGDSALLNTNGRLSSVGSFDNNSDYVRVEMAPEFRKAGDEAVPYGFEEYLPTVAGDLEPGEFQPTLRTSQSIGNISQYAEFIDPTFGPKINSNIHLGFDFKVAQNDVWRRPVPKPYVDMLDEGSGEVLFDLDDYKPFNDSTIEERKFSIALQGGFDGRDWSVGYGVEHAGNFEALSYEGSQDSGHVAYKNAVQLLQDPDEEFYNVIFTPDLSIDEHTSTVRQIESMVRERGDAIYCVDTAKPFTEIENINSVVGTFESTYISTYFGTVDVSTTDEEFDWLPACSVVPSVYARSDRISNPWFAPSGLKRGQILGVNDIIQRFTDEDVDLLHNQSINALKYFGNAGAYLWGQRTFTSDETTALSRVNVRRLMVAIISFTREQALNRLFNQNTEREREFYEVILRDFLALVKFNNGISDFDVSVEVVEDNNFKGTINIVPVIAVEHILVDFVVQNQRVTFSDLDSDALA